MADTIYINDGGASLALQIITEGTPSLGATTIRLFTAPTAVSHSTLLSAFTEATFTGYAAQALTPTSWPAPTVASHVASSAYPTGLTYTCTVAGATQQIYGWFATDAGKTTLYMCALFAAGPYPITNPGDSVTVDPTLTAQSLN